MELFRSDRTTPLAWMMQPQDLYEFPSQSHILGHGKPLGRLSPVFTHLKSANYKWAERLGSGKGYKYPHDYKEHNVEQQYVINNKKLFFPSDEEYEKIFPERLRERRSR